jgi:aerobic-type carbon monoxide dehydrogenase small subunit (CoxS/CutS family)
MATIKELVVNGGRRPIDADPARSLLSVLREDLDLTGTKYGCGEGQCGACTVLLDGEPARSCQTLVGDLGGRSITTIEGVEKDGRLHPLQEAFLQEGAMQCGYCTAGMIVSKFALLAKNASPSEPEILRSLERNICRCGTYQRIVAAVRAAARALPGGTRG